MVNVPILISTPFGDTPTGDIVVGDLVSSWDVQGLPQTNTVVEKSFIPFTDEDNNPTTKTGYQVNGGSIFYKDQSIWASEDGGVTWRVVNGAYLQIGMILADTLNVSVPITSLIEVGVDGWYRFEIDGDHSYMADGFQVHNASKFFCVDQDNNWHVASGRTNWSSASGLKDNALEPTTSDTVFFDSNSGGNCTQNLVGAAIAGFDTTGGTGTFTSTFTHSNGITIGLASTTTVLRLNSSMTYTATAGWTKATVNSATLNVTTGGKTISTFGLNTATTGFIITFQDNFTGGAACSFSVRGTTLQLSGHVVQVATLAQSVSGAVYDFGSNVASKFIITASGAVFNAAGTWSNLVSGNEVKFTGTSASSKTAAFGTSFNQPNLNITYASGCDNLIFTATTALTLGTLDISGSSLNGLTLPQGITTTVAAMISTQGGSKVQSSSGGSAATLSSTASVLVSGMSVKDITAAGSTPFVDVNGVNVSGNTNWTFNFNGGPGLSMMGIG